ncbi:Gm15127 [Phodopus roborovskii]|uniref:Gm15127 protein n=1 Tax=Phodopus roborovskii TaxID=109678 RepID=A0AAU9YY98_PHORO|nr:Gm15127 [Phodopus roborovskii]
MSCYSSTHERQNEIRLHRREALSPHEHYSEQNDTQRPSFQGPLVIHRHHWGIGFTSASRGRNEIFFGQRFPEIQPSFHLMRHDNSEDESEWNGNQFEERQPQMEGNQVFFRFHDHPQSRGRPINRSHGRHSRSPSPFRRAPVHSDRPHHDHLDMPHNDHSDRPYHDHSDRPHLNHLNRHHLDLLDRPQDDHSDRPQHDYSDRSYHDNSDRPHLDHLDRPQDDHSDGPHHDYSDRSHLDHLGRPQDNHSDRPRHDHAGRPHHDHSDRSYHDHSERPHLDHLDRPQDDHSDRPRHYHAGRPRHDHLDRLQHDYAVRQNHAHNGRRGRANNGHLGRPHRGRARRAHNNRTWRSRSHEARYHGQRERFRRIRTSPESDPEIDRNSTIREQTEYLLAQEQHRIENLNEGYLEFEYTNFEKTLWHTAIDILSSVYTIGN